MLDNNQTDEEGLAGGAAGVESRFLRRLPPITIPQDRNWVFGTRIISQKGGTNLLP
jgi:hypothetical protein